VCNRPSRGAGQPAERGRSVPGNGLRALAVIPGSNGVGLVLALAQGFCGYGRMMADLCFFTAIGLPFLAVPLLLRLGRTWGPQTGWVALVFPLLAALAVGWLTARSATAGPIAVEWPWVPSLGLPLAFRADGLSSFFGVVVSVMGVLITFYARFYLDDHYRHHGRFYAYLLIFMAAMLGTVFANHLLVLFIFWELTGITSFLLIGFSHESGESRRGARMAFLVTSLTGLCLLAGVVLMGQVSGTYELDHLLREGLDPSDPRSKAALVLVMVGAFGKSAQIPFHYWLPNAMAAPTPVSAYLHSATMVKLGVFLSARLFPVFGEFELWAPLVTTVALLTMTLGAWLALLSHDLKAILAYSTVSQLGFLIGYYGLGPPGGMTYDYLHILNHVYYKGCLFMVVGIVDHATGTRDVRRLGGLFRRMPMVGLAALLACAAMAGLPGTTGFLSKEMMLKEIFTMSELHGGLGTFAMICVVLTSLMKVLFSARIFFGVFLGPESEQVKAHFHETSRWMTLAPLLLAMGTLVCGLFPVLWELPFNLLAVEGLHAPTEQHLTLWHGFNRELAVSAALVVGGLGLFFAGRRRIWARVRVPGWLQHDVWFERGLDRFGLATKWVVAKMGTDRPVVYLPVILTAVVLLLGGFLAVRVGSMDLAGELRNAIENQPWSGLRVLVASLLGLSTLGVVVLRRWTTQLVSLTVAGFLTTFYYVLYRAPDLALTQILVETVTLFLVLLLLARFPRATAEGEAADQRFTKRQIYPLILATAVGVLMTSLVLLLRTAPAERTVGQHHLEIAGPLAKGGNVVNTILVDFRGLDTLGEITVLIIAMLGCLGLFLRYKRTPEEYRQGAKGPPGFGLHHDH
jgi:NADH:ubiquinone oxidoreductase subunit 5 (subunit L)/multisubunit Na+/H+ antiporter MnhA subunit/multisubunit Na+/H+ antiporter MnhB subunit